MHVAQERAACFFTYTSLLEDEGMFTLGSLYDNSENMDKLLLRVQLNLVHDWMDYGFKAAPINKLEKRVTSLLRTLEFAMDAAIFRQVR